MPTKTKNERATKSRPARRDAAAQPSPPPQNDNEWFELRRSSIQGLGAFAKKDIPRGTRIIEYTGEKISYAESDRRYPDERGARHHTFLFTLNSKWIVDAAFDGNDARFINHSCGPNCDAYIERGRIWIESIKRIPAGAELSYDYQYEYLDEYSAEDLEFYGCHCGAPNCRGTIVEPKKRRSKK